jgi:hypothetical protein
MTLEELLMLQQAMKLGHVHVAAINETDFTLAHTDHERATGTNTPDCRIHQWLAGMDEAPAPVGLYIVTAHEPDGYSESYRSEPWELQSVSNLPDNEPS